MSAPKRNPLFVAVAAHANTFLRDEREIIAAGALDQFADEVSALRHASRSKRFTRFVLTADRIARRLELAIDLDPRLKGTGEALARILDDLAEREGDTAAPVGKATRATLLMLEHTARRASARIVRAEVAREAQSAAAFGVNTKGGAA